MSVWSLCISWSQVVSQPCLPDDGPSGPGLEQTIHSASAKSIGLRPEACGNSLWGTQPVTRSYRKGLRARGPKDDWPRAVKGETIARKPAVFGKNRRAYLFDERAHIHEQASGKAGRQ